MIVGNNIRVWRAKRKITQAELAGKVGIAQSTLCEIETGATLRFSEETLNKIANALGVKVTELWERRA